MDKKQIKKCQNIKLHGTTTVGAKGQVVIPSSVRKELNISPGDQMLVMVKLGKALALVKANEIEELHKAITKEIEEIKDANGLQNEMKKKMQTSKNSNSQSD